MSVLTVFRILDAYKQMRNYIFRPTCHLCVELLLLVVRDCYHSNVLNYMQLLGASWLLASAFWAFE